MTTTTTTYSIVGSGNIGAALAHLFARAGVDVSIANTRGPDSLRPLATEIGAAVHPVTLADAVDADVIFLAIPFHTVTAFGQTRPDWMGKILVDVTNAFWTPGAEELLGGRLSTEFVTDAFPGGRVVKAFNQLPANALAADVPAAHGKRVIFISSNDETAGSAIAQLVEALGLAAIELGRVDEGGRLIQAQNALVLRPLIEQPRS